MNILSRVELNELIDVSVFNIPGTGHFGVEIEAKEKGKVVTFDEKTLAVLNMKISEIMRQKEISAFDPKAKEYIEEYVVRMVVELHRNGLVVIEEAPEQPDDPYEESRNQYSEVH